MKSVRLHRRLRILRRNGQRRGSAGRRYRFDVAAGASEAFRYLLHSLRPIGEPSRRELCQMVSIEVTYEVDQRLAETTAWAPRPGFRADVPGSMCGLFQRCRRHRAAAVTDSHTHDVTVADGLERRREGEGWPQALLSRHPGGLVSFCHDGHEITSAATFRPLTDNDRGNASGFECRAQ